MAKVLWCLTRIDLRCAYQLHTSASLDGQAKVFQKVMRTGTKKKSKGFYESPMLPNPKTFSKGGEEGKKSVSSKRTAVLNKLFMRYITDLMSSGECSTAFVGHGIEIDRVQVTPDFNCVNIFWNSKTPEKDDIIEGILNRNCGQLRHELAQLKVVGVIPKLRFVKDKFFAQSTKVDQLLAIADYGEDHVPSDFSTKLKSQLELNMNLEPHIVEKLSTLDQDVDDFYEEPLPPMPNNIFGLDHFEVMERIQKSKQKSRALHRLCVDTEPEREENYVHVNESPVRFGTVQEEKEAFREFLCKRQIAKDKAGRLEKNYKPEMDYLEYLTMQKREEAIINQDLQDFVEDEDFLDEDNKQS